MKVTFTCKNSKEVAKEALWLAWKACGVVTGMGVFQDNPGATKEDVLKNVLSAGDYPGAPQGRKSEGYYYADYVFGRMMKLSYIVERKGISYRDAPLRRDYESWCVVYPTYEALFLAAIESLGENQCHEK